MFQRTSQFLSRIPNRHPWALVTGAVAVGSAAGALSGMLLGSHPRRPRTALRAASLVWTALAFAARAAAMNAAKSVAKSAYRAAVSRNDGEPSTPPPRTQEQDRGEHRESLH